MYNSYIIYLYAYIYIYYNNTKSDLNSTEISDFSYITIYKSIFSFSDYFIARVQCTYNNNVMSFVSRNFNLWDRDVHLTTLTIRSTYIILIILHC